MLFKLLNRFTKCKQQPAIAINLDDFVATQLELDPPHTEQQNIEDGITKETQVELLSFEIKLAEMLLKCSKVETIRAAVAHREYLIQTMKLSLNTSARCTLALYFPADYAEII